MNAMKTCTKCGRSDKPFAKDRKSPDGLSSWCRVCKDAGSEEWRRLNQDRKNASSRRWRKENREKSQRVVASSKLKAAFGISLEDKERMLAAQGGKCACCGDPLTLKRAKVDHCHRTGRLRKVLCNPCNLGLGNFRDDPKRLQAAIAYLAEHS